MNTIVIIFCIIAMCVSLYQLIDAIKYTKEFKKEYIVSTYYHLWNTLIEDESNITYLDEESKNHTYYVFDYGNRYKILLFYDGDCALFNYDLTKCILSMWKKDLNHKLSDILETKVLF